MPPAARCHPDRPHIAKGLCVDCYNQAYTRRQAEAAGREYKPQPHLGRRRTPKPAKLPLAHPLFADSILHRELARIGLSWAACEQIRSLRAVGVSLAAIAKFYGIPVTTVALIVTHADLSKIEIEEGDVAKPRPRYRPHVADYVRFGRPYKDLADV